MTGGSSREYAAAVRKRYWHVDLKGKGRILDEFIALTGYHRKATIRLLGREDKSKPKGRRGRPREYGTETGKALNGLWEASDYLCSRQLHVFMLKWIRVLKDHNKLKLDSCIEAQLCRMSPSTIDRPLQPYRLGRKRKLHPECFLNIVHFGKVCR